MTIDQIASEVLMLSPHDRAILAQTLWESLEPSDQASDLSDDEAIGLAKKRDSEMGSGIISPLLHDQLMSRLRNAD